MKNSEDQTQHVSLKKNFSWTLFGNLFYGTSQWLMLIIIAKLGSPEMVGKFSLAFAITAPISMFANLNLRAVFATDAKDKHVFGDYLFLRVAMQFAGLCALILFMVASDYSQTIFALVSLVAIAKLFESFSDLLFGFLQKNERMDIISISLTVKSLLSLIGLGLAMYSTNDIIYGTAGITAAWLLVLLLYDIPQAYKIYITSAGLTPESKSIFRHMFSAVDKKSVRALALLSLPLGITFLFTSLVNNVPRYFIEQALGERILGIYSAMVYVIFVGIRVVTALGESATPRLAKHYALHEFDKFKNLLQKLIIFGAATGIIGIIAAATCGKTLLSLLYRPEYAEHSNVFIWLMITAAIMYISIFFEYGMNAVRKFKIQPYVIFTSLTAVTLICWITVTRIGILGAVIAVAVGYLIQLLSYWKVINLALSE